MADPERRAERPGRRWAALWLGACLLLAVAVRSHDLGGQSLWWDESLSLHRAQQSLATILRNRIDLTDGQTVLATRDNHPPLFFLVLAGSVRLLGSSEFALRLPSLFFSILLVPLLYATGKRLAGDTVGRWAALAGALSPMYLWYSQEARPYMMATFLGLLSVYAFLRLAEQQVRDRAVWMALYLIATLAMLFTHYLTLLVLAVEGLLGLLAAVRASRLVRWAWPLAIVFIAALGVLLYALSVAPPPSPQAGFTFVSLPILARDVLNSFSLGLSVNVDDVIFVDMLFLLVALAGLLVTPRPDSRSVLPPALVIVLYFAVPFALTYVAGFVRPVYMNSRHLMIITPAFYLALGAGLALLGPRRGLALGAAAVLTIAIAFSWNQYFTNEAYQKDDHRQWGAYLRANVQPGDVVVVNPPHASELYRYYANAGVPWIGLPALSDGSPAATQASLDRLSSQYQRIWLAQTYTPPWGDPDRIVEKWLDRSLTKLDERSFHSYASIVRLVRYATRPPALLAPPRISHPADVALAGGLIYLGYDAISQQAEPGRSLGFSVYLRTEGALAGDLKLSLRLLDETGFIWAQSDHMINSLQAESRRRNGQMVREDANLFIPPATPASAYRVEMVIYDASTGDALLPREGAPGILLGQAEVVRPPAPPRPSDLALTSSVGGSAGGLTLVGIRYSAQPRHQGEVIALDAYWRAATVPRSEYLVRLSLVDKAGRTAAERTLAITTPGRGTLTWQQNEVLRGHYDLTIPRDVAAGRYAVYLSLVDVASGQVFSLRPAGPLAALAGAQRIADVVVVDRPRSFALPRPSWPLSVNLGNAVTLLGFDVAPEESQSRIGPGQTVTLTLYFQSRATMDAPYSIFLHFVDNTERIWGQEDRPAGSSQYPTTLWWPGEVVSTTLTLTLSPDTPATPLTAYAGLYDPSTSVRLPVIGAPESANRFPLFTTNARR